MEWIFHILYSIIKWVRFPQNTVCGGKGREEKPIILFYLIARNNKVGHLGQVVFVVPFYKWNLVVLLELFILVYAKQETSNTVKICQKQTDRHVCSFDFLFFFFFFFQSAAATAATLALPAGVTPVQQILTNSGNWKQWAHFIYNSENYHLAFLCLHWKAENLNISINIWLRLLK